MPIVTSETERYSSFFRALPRRLSLPKPTTRKVFNLIALLVLLATLVAADALVRSYRYYAGLIDARLASGYLTSRAGLYAAPRTIRTGQAYTAADFVRVLKRAGYVEKGSGVWSGTFTRTGNEVEIRPTYNPDIATPRAVRVHFEQNGVSSITGDELPLESFTLEPEILTNDVSTRTGRTQPLAFSELPPVVSNAILAIEDRRFFEHSGVDVLAILRALWTNASDQRRQQGGSTITQQLVKNTYLSSERTLHRKYAEAMLALALERRLSKQDIFALYCNEVYLGHRTAIGARGVEQAAHLYFGKELKYLTLAEAATIAGMIKSPAHYSPERHPDAALERRNLVLNAMSAQGLITPAEYVAAAREKLTLSPLEHSYQAVAPYFVDYVNRIAANDWDTSADDSRLYTTIDLDLQQLAEAALERQLAKLNERSLSGESPQGALVALDPRTGNVLAMVGGRQYSESQLNRAVDAHRQPGSTFKPFVYAAALESGMSPVQMFSDTPREFIYDRNRIYRPANYGGGYSMREVTMRTALVKSLNVVTVDIAMRTGLSRIARYAEDFGLPRPERYPSLALGTTEVTPLELAAAYATFANGGRRVMPHAIASVAEPPGTHTLQSETQVVSPGTAYVITNMLTAAIDHGTGRAARNVAPGTAIAGKTGTSRDGWFVGYTPNLVCVVWIGFDDNRQLGLTGANAALPAWSEFVGAAVKLRPELGGRNFECPEGVKFVEIDSENGLISTVTCPHRELIAVTERSSPNLECYLHGNLPESFQEPEEGTYDDGVVVASRKPLKQEPFLPSRHTRVDIDTSGKRTLVNEILIR